VDWLSESGAVANGTYRSNAFFDESLAEQRVMAIIRGLPPADTVELCERAWRAGIEVVEVPVRSPGAIASLRAPAAAADRQGHKIGVGTVTTHHQVEQARHAGAVFTVAPGLNVDVAPSCLDAGLAHLPGVPTASEVQRAIDAQEFITPGAKVVAIGSALSDPNQIGLPSALQASGSDKGTST
jgi:2-keto-3-deoxy-6-phosphogluconate aldolase